MHCYCSALVTLHTGKEHPDITLAMELDGFWEHREKQTPPLPVNSMGQTY